MQKSIEVRNDYRKIDEIFSLKAKPRVLLVCGKSFDKLQISRYLKELKDRMGVELVEFNDFEPNPLSGSVVKGVSLFHRAKCNMILAVGGGSAIDVAKCIKLYLKEIELKEDFWKYSPVHNDIEFIAVPTTAGTGSEATKYAVIYHNGEKLSISDEKCIPSTVIFDSSTLETLPDFHRKSTMLDALSHAIESFWSINSTTESIALSKQAIETIINYKEEYFINSEEGNNKMLYASNIAGKAINITQTTAGHAMSYKLTSLYTIPHGYAAALCMVNVWEYMVLNTNKCIDDRGEEYLIHKFQEIASALGCKSAHEAIIFLKEMLNKMNLPGIEMRNNLELSILQNSVNLTRLKNNPVKLDTNAIDIIYRKILSV
ncbi:MAG: phosphonoacetaldehyde reductase [Suipraeoptans sp.]